mmetsp:Transcript_18605/g.27847  ORF Transcript_18605/g.27847 Transcript_18605/m.27847 type:complete len:122 (-) Transcript_18605:471-836(-)
MNLCRPLERTRSVVRTDCVETLLKTPSVTFKSRIKEIAQAARKDERQKLLNRFVREKKAWDAVRREEKAKVSRLQEELKVKDCSISWLKRSLNEKEDYITQLKNEVANLERHLESEMVIIV